MKCLVLLSILLVVPAVLGQPPTRTKSGPRPRGLLPPPAPAPAPVPRAIQHPTVLRKQNFGPPARGRNDVKDVPDNFGVGGPPPPAMAGGPPPAMAPAPAFVPAAVPASRFAPPPPAYNVAPAAPPAILPPTRTRTLGMLRPLPPAPPMYYYNPPVMPTGTTVGWVATAPPDVPDHNKEEEEES